MSNIYDDEKAKTNAGARKSQVWRTIWAIVFVVLSVEAILIAALINSRRAVHVTRPIISVLPGGAPKIDQSTVGKYLKESWIYEDVTLRFYGEGAVALNPGPYLDSIKADYEFIAKFAGLRDVKLPSTIYLFGNELSGALAHSGLGAGWVEGETLYLPAGRSSAKPLLEYACAKAGSSPDGALLAGVAPFLGEFLDFYNDLINNNRKSFFNINIRYYSRIWRFNVNFFRFIVIPHCYNYITFFY